MKVRLLLHVVALGFVGFSCSAQDVEYNRALDRAQQERPAELASSARIAPPTEPGPPLLVRGQVLKTDGSPAADAVIFAYHTDAAGLYDEQGKGPHSWRLRGWVKADRDGRFTFETIRPGAYPNQKIPPHLHFTAFLPNGERYHTPEFNLPAKAPAGGAEEVTAILRLQREEKF
ncbi:hypothetical protein BH20VER1_BH20VER1_15020 [soil metagenome]